MFSENVFLYDVGLAWFMLNYKAYIVSQIYATMYKNLSLTLRVNIFTYCEHTENFTPICGYTYSMCFTSQASVAYIIVIYNTEGVYKQQFNYIRYTYTA